MNFKRQVLILVWIIIVLAGCLTGCGTSTEQLATPPAETAKSNVVLPAGGVISQWGNSAESGSEFANPEWSASQAIGSPDAPGCGDYQFAWASAASDSIETLEVSFSRQVYPLEIHIHESFNPDQVVKVEVFNPDTGAYYTVLQKNPLQVDRPCPFVLEIIVEGIVFKTDKIRITVDQSQLGLGWNEIDAVKLIGSFEIE
jgi:cell division protein YceG involved in septum cleavage